METVGPPLDKFEYRPLSQVEPSIRLMRLLGDWTKSDVPVCEIFHVDNWGRYPTKYPYEALSYCWGSMKTEDIAIVDGKTLPITANLCYALRHLRTAGNRILWIDAICIDQTNLSERASQVLLMGGIFANAYSVIFWLGYPDADSDLVMHFLENEELKPKGTQRRSKWDRHDDQTSKVQRSYDKILKRPWFFRVWVVQEVAKAKSATFACGKYSVQAETFINTFHASSSGFHHHPLLDLAPGVNGSSWNNMSLYSILQYLKDHQATDGRDRIFALLGLIDPDPGKDMTIKPDYTKSESEVAKEAFLYLGGPRTKDRGEPPSSVSELVYGLCNARWPHLEAYYNLTNAEEYKRLAYLQYSGP